MSTNGSRREFLQSAGLGIGWLAALDLFQRSACAGPSSASHPNPLAPKAPPLPATARLSSRSVLDRVNVLNAELPAAKMAPPAAAPPGPPGAALLVLVTPSAPSAPSQPEAAPADPAPAPSPGGDDASPAPGRQVTVSATKYCLTGTTATGMPVQPGVIATDPSYIPLGTSMYVPGYGDGVAADTGGGVVGWTIDLWVASCA